jgi:hypothetical protein
MSILSVESEKSVSDKIVCHAQVRNIVTSGSVVQITRKSLNLPGLWKTMGKDCFDWRKHPCGLAPIRCVKDWCEGV